MSASALELIVATHPDWFSIDREQPGQLVGVAQVPMPEASSDFTLGLKILGAGSTLLVQEASTTILPASCPDRHINRDSSFCLGYGAGDDITDADRAMVWWKLLEHFLRLQRAAGRTKRWPAGHWIAHGAAGTYHLEARGAAKRLGILEEYDAGVTGARHWSTDGVIKTTKDGARILNGRMPCPMGCRDKRRKPVLRSRCPRRDDVTALIYQDRRRREEESRFWREMDRKTHPCCGTLLECPLK